jgi:hypothetical protein
MANAIAPAVRQLGAADKRFTYAGLRSWAVGRDRDGQDDATLPPPSGTAWRARFLFKKYTLI